MMVLLLVNLLVIYACLPVWSVRVFCLRVYVNCTFQLNGCDSLRNVCLEMGIGTGRLSKGCYGLFVVCGKLTSFLCIKHLVLFLGVFQILLCKIF